MILLVEAELSDGLASKRILCVCFLYHNNNGSAASEQAMRAQVPMATELSSSCTFFTLEMLG